LFDVRHLPNPYFVAELRDLSGHDRRVVNYLTANAEVQETLRRFGELLEYLLPLYRREGKAYVSVGIGCTGGRHRSVMIANMLARRLSRAGFDAVANHRDVKKAKVPKRKTESRKPKAENRKQAAASRGQKAKAGRQRAGIGKRKAEDSTP
ncbi:MAG: hypothetical protein M3R15_34185, partial [Acidobacteriota bacterium]|nr:hypothetical protein [Acidobacteriota bacterium]